MIIKNAAILQTKPVPAEYFTGTAWITSLVKNDGIPCNAVRVTFAPGSRNHWHIHPVGQILIVTEGKGYVQKKGEAIVSLLPGDVVTILANEIHWHGAALDCIFSHIAIQLISDKGQETSWLEAVTNEEYPQGNDLT